MPRLKKRADGRYQRRKTINGKSVMFYGKTLAEIDEKIAKYEKRVNAPLTFAQIADRWERSQAEQLSFTTLNGLKMPLKRAVEHFGDRLAEQITVPEVNAYVHELIAERYAMKTISKYRSIISIIYEAAILRGDVTHNPAKGWSLPRGLPRNPRKAPSDIDIDKIINTDDPWIFPRILVLAGLRRGEALALTYEDIDRKNKTISVNKEILFDGNRPVLVERTKTDAGKRLVPLPDALAAIIPDQKHGRLFDLTFRQFRTKWAKYCERVGISCTPHQLRHAYASILLDANIKDKDAQTLMGHADISTTRNIYTHILESRQSQNAAAINDYINARTSSKK